VAGVVGKEFFDDEKWKDVIGNFAMVVELRQAGTESGLGMIRTA
jgi:hypothetical protein